MELVLNDDLGFKISDDSFLFLSNPVNAVVNDGQSLNCNFTKHEKTPFAFLGIDGDLISDAGEDGDIQITREFFVSSQDDNTMAMRIILTNNSNKDIGLNKIKAIQVDNENSFLIADGKMADWKVLRFPFNKMDIPSYYKPTTVDKDFEDAVFSQIHAIPGQGCVFDTMNVETRTITSGPITIFQNHKKSDQPKLMFSILGIDNHFVDMRLTTTQDRQNLKEFVIDYNFDGVVVEPGGEISSHWLLIKTDVSEDNLLNAYADAVAKTNNLPERTKESPTVYCSWYFYTFEFTQQHLDDELEFMTQNDTPIDYFQIDDGWMDYYGSYDADPVKFPDGMEAAAQKISDAGMIPGIWLCPFVIDIDSPILKKYPDIYQCKANGEKLLYDTTTNDCYVVDPTRPGAKEFIFETFTKVKDWGYRYFKLDWLRAMYEFDDVVFYDQRVNRAMAYKMTLEWMRQAVGNDCYILGCGGFSDPGNIGLVDGQRICKDVKGMWDGPSETPKSGTLVNIKQNFMRNFSNRFWDVDPDATQIRLRDKPFSPKERKCMGVYHSQGFYTEEEAFSVCIHQYITGGLICLSERFPELQQSRLDMFRHIVPPFGGPAKVLDYDHPDCPTLFLKEIAPTCESLGKWWTLCIGNWEEHDVTRKIKISDLGLDDASTQYAVMEFRNQEFLGLKKADDEIEITIPSHGMRILRITPWDGQSTKLLGTDLHITGGACEIAEFKVENGTATGRIGTKWNYPVKVTVGVPSAGNITVYNEVVPAGQTEFTIRIGE